MSKREGCCYSRSKKTYKNLLCNCFLNFLIGCINFFPTNNALGEEMSATDFDGIAASKAAEVRPMWTNEMYYFDFQKGQTHRCGPAHKYDNYAKYAQAAAYNGDIYFVQGQSKMRAYLTDGNWNRRTTSTVMSYLNTAYKFPYYEWPASWENLYFTAYVDPASSTQWIRIWGYFQP